jgi:hypothetical protein
VYEEKTEDFWTAVGDQSAGGNRLPWMVTLSTREFAALPNPLVSVVSALGTERLQRTSFKADYEPLADSYRAQRLVSYCGVATSVSVLGAIGIKTNQYDFFTDEAAQVRSRISVIFGGMTFSGKMRGFIEVSR